ncbi:MAG: hypothetical protein H6821_15400 [Planctomycetaceae bacterium]|nr:hypothetical protein [Planctomycetales bacterium]MCB9875557.1 hypothetical protein [Planctomycetaceae bacterium]MCB9938310.1 hypothetical protein [Planctomycetaceae bacterium]HRX83142.1 hypothetical protein [Pirellulaceae bacterium]
MLRRVKLDQLPENLAFPEKLADRIHYDQASRELQFRGFMSKTDFDKLVRLHNDIDYQRSLERLFQICTFGADPEPVGRGLSTMVLAAGATVAVIALGVAAFMYLH